MYLQKSTKQKGEYKMNTYIPYETTVEHYDVYNKLVKSEKHQPLHDFNEVITYTVNPEEKGAVVKETVITADNQEREVTKNIIRTTMVPNRTEVLTTDAEDQLISKVTTTLTNTGWERVSEYPEGVVVKEIEHHSSIMSNGRVCMVTKHDTMEFNKKDPEKILVRGGSREVTETTTEPDKYKGTDITHQYITKSKVADPEQIDPEHMEIRPKAEFCDVTKSCISTTRDATYGRKLLEREARPSSDEYLMPYRNTRYARLKVQDQSAVRKSYENMLKSFFDGQSPEIKHDETFNPELLQIDWSDVTHMDILMTHVIDGITPQLTCIEIGCDELIRITVNLTYDKKHHTPHYRYPAVKVDVTVRKLACCGPDDYGVYRKVTEKYSYVPTLKDEYLRTDLEQLAFTIEKLSIEQLAKIEDSAKHDKTISNIMDQLQVQLEG